MSDVSRAARLLGVSERRVRTMLNDGALQGTRTGWSWEVDDADLERIVARRAGGRGSAPLAAVPDRPDPVLDRVALPRQESPSAPARVGESPGRASALALPVSPGPDRTAALEAEVAALTRVVAELAGILAARAEASVAVAPTVGA